MLFRRCAPYTLILLTMTVMAWSSEEELDYYLKKGKSINPPSVHLKMSKEEIEAITPKELRGQTFDGRLALDQLQGAKHQEVDRNLDVDPAVLATIESAENVLKEPKFSKQETVETTEKCLFEKEVVDLTLKKTLAVQLVEKSSKSKICQGHRQEIKCSNKEAEDKFKTMLLVQSKKQTFKADPTIKSYNVTYKKHGTTHHDLVICDWTHIDDAHNCDLFVENEGKSTQSNWEEIETWNMENPDLLSSLDCSLVNTVNGPEEIRIINGHAIKRPCWEKTLHLKCIRPIQKGCEFLKDKNCILVSESCLKWAGTHCLLLEKIFQCRKQPLHHASGINNIYGTNPSLWKTEYAPNQAFSDVTTKLAVFDEMKKQLQNENVHYGDKIQLFTGTTQQCSKSLAQDIMYDCCDSMDGLATQAKLSKCTADELALAESRKKGLCHSIGKHKGTFFGLWESRTEHVFCCFHSKLSRVFQEEARKQLNIDWGSADHPDCRGLTQQEIKGLDFSKLDLKEAFETPREVNNQPKINSIEERLKTRMKEL